MHLRSNWFVASLAAFALAASTASAATVTYTLDLSVAGSYKVFAQTSVGDNGGLVTYGIPLTGALTVDHLSPRTTNLNNFEPAGFTALRTADGNFNVAATQDTITPTSNLIYGFGQVANSFAGLGMSPAGVTEQPAWDAKLLIAQGTRSGAMDFDRASVNLLGDVFTAQGNPLIVKGTLALEIFTGGGNPPVAVDVTKPTQRPNQGLINHLFTTSSGDGPFSWGNLQVRAGSPNPGNAPSLLADGTFSWDPTNAAFGDYNFDTTVTGAVGPPDIGTLSIRIIPEPATMSLLGLALVGLVGFVRRRG